MLTYDELGVAIDAARVWPAKLCPTAVTSRGRGLTEVLRSGLQEETMHPALAIAKHRRDAAAGARGRVLVSDYWAAWGDLCGEYGVATARVMLAVDLQADPQAVADRLDVRAQAQSIYGGLEVANIQPRTGLAERIETCRKS